MNRSPHPTSTSPSGSFLAPYSRMYIRPEPLCLEEFFAVRVLIGRVLREIPARLVQAALFGSKARGEARPDSDVDILLVFAALPPDREPHAGHAEAIAAEVAEATVVPVTVWSVSLPDLAEGARTPMLVDALADSLPIWCLDAPLPALPFTPADALRCSATLLERVEEGSAEFAAHLERGRPGQAARRARDDLVRLCTALHLLRGITRPRRSQVLSHPAVISPNGSHPPADLHLVLEWARRSFGRDGRDEERPVPTPPVGPRAVADTIDYIRALVGRSRADLAPSLGRR